MNEAAMNLSQFEVPPESRIRLGSRLLVYFSVWLLVALAFQIFLQPEGLTETDLSPLQQRLLWPLYAPLMVVVGLVQAAIGVKPFPEWVGWSIVAGFGVHFLLAVTRARRSSFAAFIGIQVLVLAVGVVFFVRQS